jgi:hypothetical protein
MAESGAGGILKRFCPLTLLCRRCAGVGLLGMIMAIKVPSIERE